MENPDKKSMEPFWCALGMAANAKHPSGHNLKFRFAGGWGFTRVRKPSIDAAPVSRAGSIDE
ncbi:hypothetical protein [Bordetella petrii]|uniref:hypothetical protein n=1 Tax=Bordetella petrii TaxID=94624 RepID=UPI001E464E76|nr:hypothetical protein [Bordetella petrii]MCD0504337.1 hypothetical protein [Bordetella petrii]